MSDNQKILLLFDFDNTISDDTSTYILRKEFLTEEEYELNRQAHEKGNDWIKYGNDYLKLFKQHGVTLEKINKVLEKVKLTDGMKNLFDYVRQNKTKFDLVILTSTFEYAINYLLKYYKIDDLFNEIFCVKSKIGKPEDDQVLYISERKKHNCKDCGPCGCKSFDFNEFCESHNMNNYLKTIFICDGNNDFCLAKNLKKNDVVFPRKNYALYNRLFEKEEKNKILCDAIAWTSGNDIINYLKKLY
jgi:2,3-diketo-5-methylthio-1-phosphopentane phosphatase